MLTTHKKDKVSPRAAVQVIDNLQTTQHAAGSLSLPFSKPVENMAETGTFGTLLGMQPASSKDVAISPSSEPSHASLKMADLFMVVDSSASGDEDQGLLCLSHLSHGLSSPPSIARRQGQFVEATEQW